MKLSPIQVLASAVGAVLAAVIASYFGVKGTVVGAALGSAVATIGTALVAHSMERTNEAVRPVVDRLRDPGAPAHAPPPPVPPPPPPSTLRRTTGPLRGGSMSGAAGRGRGVFRDNTLPWSTLIGAVLGVFVLAMLAITGIELALGNPLPTIYGTSVPHGSGTSVSGLFNSGTSHPTTTTTSSPHPTTTTTSPRQTTTTQRQTTTTVPRSTTTTASTTTTTSSTTTTTGPSSSNRAKDRTASP